jgi:hypothetical protein
MKKPLKADMTEPNSAFDHERRAINAKYTIKIKLIVKMSTVNFL